MTNWDVLIVGAGQAGCAAAWDLAAAGLRVAVISRPPSRGKPCAGGVTEKAVARYRFSIAPVVREAVTSLAVSHSSSPVRHLSSATPFCVMTERAELDAFFGGRRTQRLGISIGDDEVDALDLCLHHVGDGVAARTTDTDDHDLGTKIVV